MKKIVYIDFDDVLCETAQVLAQIINTEFNKNVSFEQIDSFDLTKSFDLDNKESTALFEMFHKADVLMRLPPIEGALDTLHQWQSKGIQIHIVTGRPPETAQISQEWLTINGFTPDRISFVDKYNRGHTAVAGVDTLSLTELQQLPFALAIDDSPIAITFLLESMTMPVIVFDRPWNISLANEQNQPRITRCRTWQEINTCTQNLLF